MGPQNLVILLERSGHILLGLAHLLSGMGANKIAFPLTLGALLALILAHLLAE
jgi:hypothetical protein